jgi:DNA-binding response OmpR family regulator
MDILVLEDHAMLRNTLKLQLQAQGHRVTDAEATEDLFELEAHRWDLALLDVNLPGESGLSFAKRLRAHFPKIVIVMLTANDQLEDKIKGYRQGADIYLTKPVDPKELNAVLHAMQRRIEEEAVSDAESCHFDMTTRLLSNQAGHVVQLSVNEAKLLYTLLIAEEQKAENYQIRTVLDLIDSADMNSMQIICSRLRKKLIHISGQKNPLQSIRSYGYQLKVNILAS